MPVSNDYPLPTDIWRDYTLEFEITVERAFADLRECLREAFKDKDFCKDIANTFMEDIKEKSNMQDSELDALKVKLDQRGPAPPSIEAKCV